MTKLNKSTLGTFARKFLRALLAVYKPSDYRRLSERKLLPALAVTFQQHFGKMSREVKAGAGKSKGRIDFKYGTNNPVLIEVAVRRAGDSGKAGIAAKPNRKELLKLGRCESRMAFRFLLLLDLGVRPILKSKLNGDYDQIVADGGNVKWDKVHVIYVHASGSYSFPWTPQSHKSKSN